jgi:hypothetical protein
MQHNPRTGAKLAAAALVALGSVYATTGGAVAQPRRQAQSRGYINGLYATTEGVEAQPRRQAQPQTRGYIHGHPATYINGHISLCGEGTIPVKVYAAEYYWARPLVCGGGRVNSGLNPDFQLRKGG